MLILKYCKPYTFIRNLSKIMSAPKVAVCQLTATNAKEKNLKTVEKLISEAAKKEAQVVFLPECCDYMANNSTETRLLAETIDGVVMSTYKTLAKRHKIWLSIGGFHELRRNQNGEEILQNSHVLINENGEIASVYGKIHLFDVDSSDMTISESSYVTKGSEIVPPVNSPVGPIGLMICYDLRFPEPSIILRSMGASILTYPSAFTNNTGKAHWDVLLRARAVENQCYVIAAAQYGYHNSKRLSYGQAMIVDPWGTIVAECPKYNSEHPTNESLAIAAIDLNYMESIRKQMPVFSHRRNDIYELSVVNKHSFAKHESNFYTFDNKKIPSTTVFYTTRYSYAFTNIRCVVPGHVLVASVRQAKRLKELSPEEISDLFQTVSKVQNVMEQIHECTSSTICIQDGKDAGQTVSHVHCHILPRKPGDFIWNDEIYHKLQEHDKEDNCEPIRSILEMEKEASLLRSYF